MKTLIKTISFMVLFTLILAACGGAPEPTSTPEMPAPVFDVSSEVSTAESVPAEAVPAEAVPAEAVPVEPVEEEEQPEVDPMMICAANIELPIEPAYPLVFCDDFENPDESLMTGEEYEDKYLESTSEIYKGKYAVRMDVKRLAVSTLTIPVSNARDFVIQVDGKMASHSGHPYHKWGILLKKDPKDKLYYYFAIDNNGLYYFMMVRGEKLTNLINGRKSEDLNPLDEGNTLTVVTEGDIFTFYINGEFQEDFKDNRIQSGDLGLYFIVSENSILDWEFDNLVVYAD